MEINSFKDCVDKGGKVEERKLKDGRYIKVCIDCNGATHGQKPFRKKNNKKNKKVNLVSKPSEDSLLKLKEHFDNNFRL